MGDREGSWMPFIILVGMVFVLYGLAHPDQHQDYLERFSEKPAYTAKSGEKLPGLKKEIVLLERESNDPVPVFNLRMGNEKIWRRCDWGEYLPPRGRHKQPLVQKAESLPATTIEAPEEKRYTFGSVRLPFEWGDHTIHVLDLTVTDDGKGVIIRYCVD